METQEPKASRTDVLIFWLAVVAILAAIAVCTLAGIAPQG